MALYGVIVGIALTMAFGPASRRPLAVLNRRGLQVRSELKLAWEELAGLTVTPLKPAILFSSWSLFSFWRRKQTRRTRFRVIGFIPNDPAAVLARNPGAFRWLSALRVRMYGTPLLVMEDVVTASTEQIVEAVRALSPVPVSVRYDPEAVLSSQA